MTDEATTAPTFVPKHPELIRFPLMEQPVVGAVLAFIAGLLNAWTLANAQTFATVQSGNVVSSGYYLVEGDWSKLSFAFISVIAFGLGSAACGVLMTALLRKGVSFSVPVLFIQAGILVVLMVLAVTGSLAAHVLAWCISFVAGAQGNAFHKDRGMLYGAVAVTFVVQMAFNFLVQSLFSREGINGEKNLSWAGIFFAVLAGFCLGGGLGFAADKWVFNGAAILAAALATAGIALAGTRGRLTPRIDPTPGGHFA